MQFAVGGGGGRRPGSRCARPAPASLGSVRELLDYLWRFVKLFGGVVAIPLALYLILRLLGVLQ